MSLAYFLHGPPDDALCKKYTSHFLHVGLIVIKILIIRISISFDLIS